MAMIGTLSAAERICQSCFQSMADPLRRGQRSDHRHERCPRRRGSARVASNPWLFFRLLDLGVENHLSRPGYPAILSHAPEVQDHEDGSNDGNADAVPDVRAQERVGVHNRSAKQSEAHIIVRSHPKLWAKRAFVA